MTNYEPTAAINALRSAIAAAGYRAEDRGRSPHAYILASVEAAENAIAANDWHLAIDLICGLEFFDPKLASITPSFIARYEFWILENRSGRYM